MNRSIFPFALAILASLLTACSGRADSMAKAATAAPVLTTVNFKVPDPKIEAWDAAYTTWTKPTAVPVEKLQAFPAWLVANGYARLLYNNFAGMWSEDIAATDKGKALGTCKVLNGRLQCTVAVGTMNAGAAEIRDDRGEKALAYKCTLETNDLGTEMARDSFGEIRAVNYGHDGDHGLIFKPGQSYDCRLPISPDGNVETPPAQ